MSKYGCRYCGHGDEEESEIRKERDAALRQVAQDAMAYGQRITALEVKIDTLRDALERVAACPTNAKSTCRMIASQALRDTASS